MRSMTSIELGYMEHDASAVALRAQEAGKAVAASHLETRDALRDSFPDRPGLDLEPDLAGLAVLRDLRFVLQAQIEGRQTGWGVSQRASLHQLRGQNQAVHSARGEGNDPCVLSAKAFQAEASCGGRSWRS